MKSIRLIALAVASWALRANAHFVFVVPEGDASKASVVLSEDLRTDEAVSGAPLAASKLSVRDASGKETPLSLRRGEHACSTELPGTGRRIVHGVTDFGIYQRGQARPALLLYHPKTILGDAFADSALGAAQMPVEINVAGKAGALKFAVQIAGKPAAGADVTVILPDGTPKKVTTDADGNTPAFEGRGRYGAWARYVEATPGEREGKKYDEVRHYATLVADVPQTLPQAVSSFGAVACDGYLYVYGGHVATTHEYSTAAVSGQFHRMKLPDGAWEELPGGPAIQGMNLAAHGGKVYRVGGMEPRNKPGEKADNYSLTTTAVYDPAKKAWDALPAMPAGRSSHDVSIVGDRLYVLGGWTMLGNAGGNKWPDTALVIDLSAAKPEWKPFKQPFQRRALIVATLGEKICVLGGFDEASEASNRVDILDTKTGAWSVGPELPGKSKDGFAPAACVANGAVYVSVADGTMYRMKADGWDKIATTTPRIVHRLVTFGDSILILGGAADGKNLDLIETVQLTAQRSASAKSE